MKVTAVDILIYKIKTTTEEIHITNIKIINMIDIKETIKDIKVEETIIIDAMIIDIIDVMIINIIDAMIIGIIDIIITT